MGAGLLSSPNDWKSEKLDPRTPAVQEVLRPRDFFLYWNKKYSGDQYSQVMGFR